MYKKFARAYLATEFGKDWEDESEEEDPKKNRSWSKNQ